jgi:hypothetical protein
MFPVILLLGISLQSWAQRATVHEGRPALEFSNGRIELVMIKDGGAFASLVLKDDPKPINPMWDPVRLARETGAPQRFGAGTGHFLCVDGFGPPTPEEQAAGLQGHGEAHRLPWQQLRSSAAEGEFRVRLPLAQEGLSRKVSIAAGEQIVLVESELESETAFDRPILWAEHGTIGAPFLALGKVVVDQSVTDCQTKPYNAQARGLRTFPSAKNFTWPNLPLEKGTANLRLAPATDGTMNHIGCLMTPAREHAFITALNTEQGLLIGYFFRRADYPWVQHWMNYPDNRMYSWGLEFGMQPYDMTRREILALSPMFGAPTFRWLPAKSKVATRFLMFLTRVPEGFARVDDVRLTGGSLILEDRAAAKTVSLACSRIL